MLLAEPDLSPGSDCWCQQHAPTEIPADHLNCGGFATLVWYKRARAQNLTLCIIFVLKQESEQFAVKSSRKYLSLAQLWPFQFV